MSTPLGDEIDRLRAINADLLAACRRLVADAEMRPGAYLHCQTEVDAIRVAIAHAEEVQP